MDQPRSHLRYEAFLLRLWQEQTGPSNHSDGWRFSLQDVESGERHGFSSLESLLDFLKEEVARDQDARGFRKIPGK